MIKFKQASVELYLSWLSQHAIDCFIAIFWFIRWVDLPINLLNLPQFFCRLDDTLQYENKIRLTMIDDGSCLICSKYHFEKQVHVEVLK